MSEVQSPSLLAPPPAGNFWLTTFFTVLAVFVPVLGTVLMALVFIYTPRPSTRQYEDPFCCGNEARQLAAALNTSLDPCMDFHSYVCINTVKNRLYPSLKAGDVFDPSISTGTLFRDKSASFLSSLYRSCVGTIWKKTVLLEQIAGAVTKYLELTNHLTIEKALRYIITTAVRTPKIAMAQVILIETRSLLSVDFGGCRDVDVFLTCRDCLDITVKYFNSHIGGNITSVEVLEFTRFLRQRYPRRYTFVSEDLNSSSLPKVFGAYKEVWLKTLRSSAKIFSRNISKLEFRCAPHMETFLEAVASAEHDVVGRAYMLVQMAQNLFDLVTPARFDGQPSQKVFATCLDILGHMAYIRLTVDVEKYTDLAKDRQVVELYETTLHAVISSLESGSIFTDEDIPSAVEFLRSLLFLTPRMNLVQGIDVPSPVDNFGECYYSGLAYESNATLARQNMGLPRHFAIKSDVAILEKKYVMIAPAFYGLLKFEASKKLLNYASLATKISSLLWDALLTNVPSSSRNSRTSQNLKDYRTCVGTVLLSGRRFGFRDRPVLSRTLGLASVLDILRGSKNWELLKPAWGFWKLSESQLFYLTFAFHLCSSRIDPTSIDAVNVPLKLSHDFCSAFQCVPQSAMCKSNVCAFGNISEPFQTSSWHVSELPLLQDLNSAPII